MTVARAFAVVSLALALAGCGQKASDRALIKDLKILAVRAEPPEVAPGGNAALDALVADPGAGGRPLTRLWALCLPDPVQGVSSCTEPSRIIPLGSGETASVTVPANALDGLPPEQQLRGIDLFVVFAVHGDATATVAARDIQAFKRLRVSTAPAPNANPRLFRFDVGGVWLGPASVKAGDSVGMSATVTSASLQSYNNPSSGQIDTENMKFTWLMTAGELADAVTFDDNPGAETPGGSSNVWLAAPPATLWVVVRDPRGGTDWMTRDVTPTP